MITKFSVLYVGQIELDNIGRDGTPADARRYSNERFAEAFWTARDIAQTMDELGYYAMWTAEHHFQREGYEVLPNLIQLSLWLATQTKRLKFGCAFNILPMWHPLRLAEDYAMADIVTGGRVIMGVGRGYHTREVESFGAPLLDAAANRELFEEQFEVLLKCFNEEAFYHRGKYYTIPPDVDYRGYRLREITCVPRPLHRPVEIWMPIASGKTIDFMGKHGLKAMVTLNGEKLLDQVVRAYRDACARHGREKQLGEDMCWGAGVYLAPPRRRRSAASSPPTTSGTSGSRRSASSATPTPKAVPGARRAHPRACRRSRTASSRRRGCWARPRRSSRLSNPSRPNTRASISSWSTGPRASPPRSSKSSSAGSRVT